MGCVRLCLLFMARLHLSLSRPEDRTGYDELGNDPIRSEVHQVSAGENAVGGAKTTRTDLN